jgi:hypothetical protein
MFGFHLFQMLFDSFFVEVLGLAFDHFQGVARTFSQAGTQAVTVYLGRQSGLPVHDLKGSFRTGGDTGPAAVTFCLIDLNDLPFYFHLFLL